MFLISIIKSVKTFQKNPFLWRDQELSLLIPIAVCLAAFLVIKSVFSQEDNHPLVAMIVGMIVATCWRVQQSKRANAPRNVKVGATA